MKQFPSGESHQRLEFLRGPPLGFAPNGELHSANNSGPVFPLSANNDFHDDVLKDVSI